MTALDVLNIAIDLMNRRSRAGVIGENELKIYRYKTPNILTIIHTELMDAENLKVAPIKITDLNTTLLISDRSALMIAPYGLAAHLSQQEGLDTAGYFNDRYEELLREIPLAIEPIVDNLNVTSGMGDTYG